MCELGKMLVIKKCTLDDLDSLMQLQDYVVQRLDNPDYLRVNTREMFAKCLQDPNIAFGLFDGDEMISIMILYDDSGSDEDLSLGLEKFSVKKSINYKLSIVKNEYRGQNIQNDLIWIMSKYAFAKGYTDGCGTVSPDNKYSYNNMVKNGFQEDHIALKYGNKKRAVMYLNIENMISPYNDALENENKQFDTNPFKCFLGSIDIATTGDIIEYQNDSNEQKFVRLINTDENFVVWYDQEKKQFNKRKLEQNIDGFELKNIWINPSSAVL